MLKYPSPLFLNNKMVLIIGIIIIIYLIINISGA